MKITQFLVFLLLAGCGSAYISPSISEDAAEVDFKLVPMTASSVLKANKSSYAPKKLPIAFSKTTGIGATRQSAALPQSASEEELRPQLAETRVPAEFVQKPYEIGVGDVLVLATPTADASLAEVTGLIAAQNRRQGYTVQDDGAIAVPSVGRIQVADMTLDAAEAEVFQSLVKSQMNPTFSLEISEFNSKRVSIGGAVAQPILAPITLKRLFLDEALQLAGGVVAQDLDYATVRIYRDGKLYQIPLTELFSKRKLQQIPLKDGDRVFVDTEFELDRARAYFTEQITLAQFRQAARSQALAELNAEFGLRSTQLAEARANFTARVEHGAEKRDYVYLAGEVSKQSRFALPFGQTATLADALYSEGGIPTKEANVSQIYVLRGPSKPSVIGDVTVYHLDAQNVVNLHLATKFELRPNDLVFIAEQPVTRWSRIISQITPSLITAAAGAALN